MTDFAALLDVQADQVERPKTKPVGTYKLRVLKMPEQVESRDKNA